MSYAQQLAVAAHVVRTGAQYHGDAGEAYCVALWGLAGEFFAFQAAFAGPRAPFGFATALQPSGLVAA